MGRVYRAIDTKLHEEVAIKLIRPDISSDQKTLERFHNELKLARKIAHRNVGKMYELMEEKGSYFITMEYIPGEDLRSFVRRARQLTVRTAVLIGKEIGEGLAEAHRLGVVHRDLKPSNIIIDREGHARIMDFGIARSLESKGITGAGMIIGTPEYMSPEQAEGQEVDQRSDIYSLGVMLFEMLTGRVPFEGRTPLGIALKHKTEIPPDPRTLNPQIPVELSRLILRSLMKDKQSRYQSAAEILAALDRIEQGLTAEQENRGEKPGFLKSLYQLIKKRKVIETLVGFIGGGWLFLEFVHWILIDHYHFAEKSLDAAFILLLGTLACTLIWRLFGGEEKKGQGSRELAVRASMVAVIAVTGILDWKVLRKPESPPPTPVEHSVAVLPFVDRSPEKNFEYLSDGISESLINALNRIKDLSVSARTSAFFFKGKELDIREIGRKLNVENALEGSLQVEGDTLRITVNLISIKDGFQLWSDRYDRKMIDMFAIQDEIIQEIIKALKVKLLGEEKLQLAKKPTEDLEAYDYYVKGRYLWEKRTEAHVLTSIDLFRKAIEEDPNYALAYAGLADAYSVLGDNGYLPDNEAYPQAKEAVLKALELDDNLAEAHAAMGTILGDYDWDWAGAEKEYKLAIKINPGYAQAHHWYAFLLTYLGRHEEAIREVKLARDLDPVAPRIATSIGALLFYARQYDQASEELKKALKLFPEHRAIYYYLVDVLTAQGRFKKALSYCRKIKGITGNEPEELAAGIYAKWGKRKEAEERLKKLEDKSKNTYVDLTTLAVIHGLLGEAEQAFQLLDRALAKRESSLCFLKVEPCFDSLRPDPRFMALLKKMNLVV